MPIYRRAGSRFWWIRISREGGSTLRESTRTGDRREALQYEAKRRLEIESGDRPKKAVTWDEAAARWHADLSVKVSTAALYERTLAWLAPLLGGAKLEDIDLEVVRAIRSAREYREGGGKASAATVNSTLQCLGAVLRHAHELGWMSAPPRIRLAKKEPGVVRWMDPAELSALLRAAHGQLLNQILVAINTGLRRNNIVRMRWSWVDFSNRVVRLPASEVKTGRNLVIPLNDAAIAAIRAQVGLHAEAVFVVGGAPATKWPYTAWNSALRRAGITNLRVHDLRHHWASMHVMAGTPLHVLMELGGWSSLNMVTRYAHLSTQHLSDYAGRVDTGTAQVRHLHSVPKQRSHSGEHCG